MRSLFPIALLAWRLSAQTAPYLDPSQPIDDRVRDLISRMTLEEKAAQLNHLSSANPRLGIPAWGGWNQTLHGVWSKRPTTLFPIATAMAATWDPVLIRTITDAMSDEARALYNAGAEGPRAKHGLVFRSPVINISRDPRWGRIQECFGEDPYLTGRMAVAYVQGLQGNDPKYLKVASTLKHFAVNNVEKGRFSLSAEVPERALFEYWLPHWKAGLLEGGAQSVMAAYNAINGVPCIANKYLLTDILRNKWHWDGFVVSDLGGIGHLMTDHKLAGTIEEVAAKAIAAGCDYDDQHYQDGLPAAVKKGLVSEDVIDRALARVLRVAFKLGVFDPQDQVPFSKISTGVIDCAKHRDLALRTALESIVLLTNKNGFLPLSKNRVKSVAVIGPQADKFETGNYFGAKPDVVSPIQGLKEKLGPNVRVEYKKGCGIVEPAVPAEIDRAVQLAAKSDIAILFVGTNLKVEAEGRDRSDLNLPGAQQQLLEAVYKANPKTVLVLMNAGPLAVKWAKQNVPAILQAWYPGEEGGTAIASVLFGDHNPAGRLPYTVYESVDQVPPNTEYDVTKGFTYMYLNGEPLYAFGHGLSYTGFRYGKLSLSNSKISASGKAEISIEVRNTGKRDGDEVVQLYVHALNPSVKRPIKELRGFQRLSLKPGESRTVKFSLPASQLAFYDVSRHDFTVEPGQFDILVGSSSADIRARSRLEIAK